MLNGSQSLRIPRWLEEERELLDLVCQKAGLEMVGDGGMKTPLSSISTNPLDEA